MAKLSHQLISTEEKGWRSMNKSLKDTNGFGISFGRYMNDKYNLDDKELEEEESSALALLILLKNHAKEFK
jgi:hypothetical protein